MALPYNLFTILFHASCCCSLPQTTQKRPQYIFRGTDKKYKNNIFCQHERSEPKYHFNSLQSRWFLSPGFSRKCGKSPHWLLGTPVFLGPFVLSSLKCNAGKFCWDRGQNSNTVHSYQLILRCFSLEYYPVKKNKNSCIYWDRAEVRNVKRRRCSRGAMTRKNVKLHLQKNNRLADISQARTSTSI